MGRKQPEERSVTEDWVEDWMDPAGFAEQMVRFWEMQLFILPTWCATMTDMFWPHHILPHSDPHYDEEHEQLHVPDALEDDGERALFA